MKIFTSKTRNLSEHDTNITKFKEMISSNVPKTLKFYNTTYYDIIYKRWHINITFSLNCVVTNDTIDNIDNILKLYNSIIGELNMIFPIKKYNVFNWEDDTNLLYENKKCYLVEFEIIGTTSTTSTYESLCNKLQEIL